MPRILSFTQALDKAFTRKPALKEDLAREFGVFTSTVEGWAHDTANPHPRVQKLILGYIKSYR